MMHYVIWVFLLRMQGGQCSDGKQAHPSYVFLIDNKISRHARVVFQSYLVPATTNIVVCAQARLNFEITLFFFRRPLPIPTS